MSKYLRGQDINVFVRRDGVPIASVSVNSGSFNPGLEVETIPLAGRKTPDVDGTNGVAVLTLDLNPKDPDWLTLFEAQRRKNAGDEEFRDSVIDAEVSIDWGVSGRRRVLLTDAVLSDGTQAITGTAERAGNNLTLTASDWRTLT